MDPETDADDACEIVERMDEAPVDDSPLCLPELSDGIVAF